MKGKNILILLLFVLFIWACKTTTVDIKPPAGILEKEKFTELLVDIHLAEANGYMKRINSLEKTSFLEEEYAKVLKHHEIELDDLEKSYDWYLNHPLIFDLIYDEVIERIKIQEQFATTEEPELKEEFKDSVQKQVIGKKVKAIPSLLPPSKVTK